MSGDQSPDRRTEGLIRQRVTSLWSGSNVEVVFVWDGGSKRYYFRWAKPRHVRAKNPFAKTVSRIVALMNDGVLFDEFTVLRCEHCKAQGIKRCRH